MRGLSNKCLFFDKRYQLSITVCSFFILSLIIIFMFVFFFIRFDFVSSYSGYVAKGDDFYVFLYLSDNELQNLKENVLVVNGKKHDYDVFMISEEYVLSESGPVRKACLKFDIDDDYKIVNNVIKLNFCIRKTFFDFVKERFI